jgi:transaldolase
MVKIFADGADITQMHQVARNPIVKGFTTNPTLCKKAGVKSFEAFAHRVVNSFPDKPISFEVFSDDFQEMENQAWKIAGWGDNVYVKIPVCNTKGESAAPLIGRLSQAGIKVNVTAVFCYAQIEEVFGALGSTPAIISIFAGRIADTGRNPAPFISHALKQKKFTFHEVLWASPRQVYDVYWADSLGCDIITVTPEIIGKLPLEGKSLIEYSIDTVKMFFDDAKAAGFQL